MPIFKYMFSSKISRFYKSIKKVAIKEGKSPFLMYMDFIYCGIKYKSGLADYVNYEFYKKTSKEKAEYITVIGCDKLYDIASPDKYKNYFSIKPNFIDNFRKYVDRDYVTYEMGYDKFLAYLKKHDTFFLKPINGLGGHEVEKIKTKDIKDKKRFYEDLKLENRFMEDAVIQHKDMMALSPSSVNTVRVMTYANKGKSEIFFACVRVGNGVNNVDNFHQGGMTALVDIESGKVIGDAVNKTNSWFSEHPATHIKFDGYQLPNWKYVKKMVLEAALVNENIHIVGWDVAITEESATFIEGNRRPGWDLVQQLYKRGRNDISNRFIADLKSTK